MLGYVYVDEALADGQVTQFIRTYFKETIETLPKCDIDLQEYQEMILKRFMNPAIKDTIHRLLLDTSKKLKESMAPAARDLLALGKPCATYAASFALFAKMCLGEDEKGASIDI